MSDEDEGPKEECPEGLPPWMGTFADLMSLLMCFFVLLLSFSEMDAMKFKRLAGSMAQAFGIQNRVQYNDVPKGTSIIAQEFSPARPEPTPINEIFQHTDDITKSTLEFETEERFDIEQGEEGLDDGIKARVKQKLEEMFKRTEETAIQLAMSLSEQIANEQVEIETQTHKIIIRIREKGSFISGSAVMAPEYVDAMEEVREVISGIKGSIAVEGHTDDIPLSGRGRFRSNWDLSAARAVSVATELMRGGIIKSNRFQVTGFADARPLVEATDAVARARNRRVEIVIRQGLDDVLKDDIKTLKETDKDILRDLDLDPQYLFELEQSEIF